MGKPIIKKLLLGFGYYILFNLSTIAVIVGFVGILVYLTLLIWFTFWFLSKQYSRQEAVGLLAIFNLVAGLTYYLYNTEFSKIIGIVALIVTAILAFEYYRTRHFAKKSPVQLQQELEKPNRPKKKLDFMWPIIAFAVVFGLIYMVISSA